MWAPRGPLVMPQLEGCKVHLVSLYYTPDQTGIAPYAASYAQTMRRNGAIVTVDAGLPHYPSWRIPEAYRRGGRRQETLDGVTVRRHRHAVPQRHGLAGRARYEGSFLLSLLAAKQVDSDIVIAVTPALAGAAAAAWCARRADVPFGVIVQDLVAQAAGQAGVAGGQGVASMLERVETRILRAAQAVGVITSAFQAALEKAGVPSDRFVSLPNHALIGIPRRGRDETRSCLGWPLDRPIVLHSGNMGAKQDLRAIIEVARVSERRAGDVCFVLMGDGNQRDSLYAAAHEVPNLRIQDPVAEDLYPDVLASADLLLVNERPTVLDMSLPSKLTSYFASGRPVIARVNSRGATAQEVRRSGGGVVVSDVVPEAVLDAIAAVLDDGQTAARLAAHGRQYVAATLNPIAAEHRLLTFVNRALHA